MSLSVFLPLSLSLFCCKTMFSYKYLKKDVSTLLMVEQQPSLLQHQSEAGISLSLCMKQRPRIRQGFELQRDDLHPRPARPHAASVEQAAAAVKVGHVRSYRMTKTHINRQKLLAKY